MQRAKMVNPTFMVLYNKVVMYGRVYGHPKFPDGTDHVTTSRIRRIDFECNRVVTQNTEYEISGNFGMEANLISRDSSDNG